MQGQQEVTTCSTALQWKERIYQFCVRPHLEAHANSLTAIRGLAKFTPFNLARLHEEKTTKQQNRKVKWSYSKIMDEPTPCNCYWPVKWVEKKNFPPLRNRKSCCAEQSSGKRGGNEQVYLSEPPKTVQEALQEAMKGSPGCRQTQRPSQAWQGRAGPRWETWELLLPGSKEGAWPCGTCPVASQQAVVVTWDGAYFNSKQKLSEECRKH